MAAQFIAPPTKQSQLKTGSPFQHSDFHMQPKPQHPDAGFVIAAVWAPVPSDTKFFQTDCRLEVLSL